MGACNGQLLPIEEASKIIGEEMAKEIYGEHGCITVETFEECVFKKTGRKLVGKKEVIDEWNRVAFQGDTAEQQQFHRELADKVFGEKTVMFLDEVESLSVELC